MIAMIIGALIALVAIVAPFTSSANSYSSDLDRYIKRKNPTNMYDVERFTREFEEKHSRPFI